MRIWPIVIIMVIGVLVSYRLMTTHPTPAGIIDIDYEDKIAYVRLHSQLVSGSDGACQAAGMTIQYIIEELGTDWRVHIVNTWVPSSKNPIDYAWAKILAEGY